ncbi:CARDB domain-containing protein [Chloroflexota bacterium]
MVTILKRLIAVFLLLVLVLPVGLAGAQEPEDLTAFELFSDDFKAGLNPAWQVSGGWTVQQAGPAMVLVTTTPGLAWVQRDADWGSAYVFRSAVRLDQGTLALSFMMLPEARYIVQFQADGLYLTKEQPAGNFTVLAQAAPPTLGEAHAVTIGVESGHIQVYVDRGLLLDAVDPAPLLDGTIALGALENTTAAVGFVHVLELLHPLPEGGLPAPPPMIQPGGPESDDPPPEGASEEGWPDPVIAHLSLSNESPTPGETFTVSTTIQNQGTAPLAYYDLVIVHQYEAAGPNNPAGVESLPVLQPGEQIVIDLPNVYFDPGTYHMRVLVSNDWYLTGNVDPGEPRQQDVYVSVAGDGELPPQAAGAPDLSIASANAAVMPSPPGTVVTNYMILNNGDTDAGAFTVRWYPHGTSDMLGCSEDVGGLPAGQSVELSCIFTYPEHGEMHWRVIVDEDGEIAEANEDNNAWRGTVVIAGAGPAPEPPPQAITDIVFTDVAVRPLTTPNQVDVVVTLQNSGDVATPTFTTIWFPHGNNRAEVGCAQDFTLAAGEAQQMRCQYTYPRQGEMHWLAVADFDNDVAESNETNNEWGGMVMIGGAGQEARTDVIITDAAVRPLTTPRQVDVVVTIQNSGAADTPTFTAIWFPHARNHEVVGCVQDFTLAAGDTQQMRCQYTYPQQGEMNWKAVADFDNDVVETDESNNEWLGATQISD